MIVVTHEMGFAREVSDRIVFMDDGPDHRGRHAGRVPRNPREERTSASSGWCSNTEGG